LYKNYEFRNFTANSGEDRMKKILITGMAGFIGANLAGRMRDSGFTIVGIDQMAQNHDSMIRLHRLENLGIRMSGKNEETWSGQGNLSFTTLDLNDPDKLDHLFSRNGFDLVIHLAAQTGVRNSVSNPGLYVQNNITGFLNLLECCKNHQVKNLLYASSSSVYGINDRMPYTEIQSTDTPVSVYAVTKKTNELLAHTYSHLNSLSAIGLRFFTVYGPWCRTDMAAYIFMKSIMEGREINLFNDGDMHRDFTYVDDITESIARIVEKMFSGSSVHGFEIINVGNSHPYTLSEYLACIEKELGKKARIRYKPLQEGEIVATNADVNKLAEFIQFKPATSLEEGVRKMAEWFRNYYPRITEDGKYM
jgi:UDP-glucuronate 4-epimerase